MVGPPHCLTMASDHPPAWTGLYPSFFPNFEERAREKRVEVGSSALPNWVWQLHGAPPTMPLFSSAASSGFSTVTSTAALPPPPTITPNLHFPPSTTPHYYFRG
eukprot:TRINITY_DN4946_c0_g6_i1.p1 TRINITY_DN4946_c0_g6~~TRINITY_DN4946_c0_g6_i1.p1  ORF type:complete len:118 (+),score=17.79 TRINITY_DN4946_c0_g6_i1:44-355(+)